MQQLQQTIQQKALEYKDEFIAIRRHLHAHPELSYKEFETALFVEKQLEKIGITNYCSMATTGVVAIIEGVNPTTRVVALRADMDALPITEQNDIVYKSTKDGIMHACGHDVHTTCLLGAAKVLFETKHIWEGTIKLIFQPGEEKNPGGASIMIKEGVLTNPVPNAIIGLHVHPQLEVGQFSFRAGAVMASADELYITIKGKGGHAAAPHVTTDIILVASNIIVGLQQIISRHNNPFNPSVLSITSFQAGTTTNIIPSEVQLKGTLRCMDETWRSKAQQLIKKYIEEMASTMGATADVHIDVGYPMVYNNPTLYKKVWELAVQHKGADAISETELRMGAEDFAYYSQQIPACFFRLGAGNAAKGIQHNVHTPYFNVDENCIPEGIAMMAWLGTQV
jgi:amidohydrolase